MLLLHNWNNIPPCRSISNLQFDFEDVQIEEDEELIGDPQVHIKISTIDTTFKEINQVRAYDIQSLIGNAGGYLGLFLGYSIVHFPILIVKVFNNIKHFVNNRQQQYVQ